MSGAPRRVASTTIVIGHRGVGKSSFLRRAAGYWAGRPGVMPRFRDLDDEITARTGRPVSWLFEQEGEARFREREAEVFTRLHSEALASGESLFLAVGGGFEAPVPVEVRRLWLRRTTDATGRIFLDRPRLNSRVAPFEEFQERFAARERRYRELATDVWTVSEGFDFPNPLEKACVLNLLDPADQAEGIELRGSPALTLLPANFREEAGGFADWIARRLSWRHCRFELRDDLLGPDQIDQARSVIPADRIIYSFRHSSGHSSGHSFRRERPGLPKLQRSLARQGAVDWPLELGTIPEGVSGVAQGPVAGSVSKEAELRPTILSLHERAPGESVGGAGERLEGVAAKAGEGPALTLKLAVEVRNFQELKEGHLWAARDPARRAFLPRSTPERAGRWVWYRAWTLHRTPLGFLREAEGSSLDQPLLMEWLRMGATGGDAREFAAVLGDPVAQSRTPAEQFFFFEARGIPVLAIPVTEAEWDQGALEVLGELGLRYAAVTSPLKHRAFAACDPGAREDFGLGAINTLYRDRRGRWGGTNTDLAGFKALLPLEEEGAAVWGGGGTLEVLRRVIPGADFYSARTGRPRGGGPGHGAARPRTLIWAVGRSRMGAGSENRWPPPGWRPERVVDLNYGEDSPGREYALQTGARYESGLVMFREQASRQRSYWEEREKNDLS